MKEIMEIGIRLFCLISILLLIILQIVAWYMGFNGQLTTTISAAIVGLIMLVTGIKINPKSIQI